VLGYLVSGGVRRRKSKVKGKEFRETSIASPTASPRQGGDQMGRTGSPRKPSPSLRTLSSRVVNPSLSFAPSPLSRSQSTSPPPTSSPMAPKRTIDQVATSTNNSTPKNLQKNKRQRQRKNKRDTIASKLGEEHEQADDLEEGEVVEGDYSDLFMVDTTPAQVSKENLFFIDDKGDTSVTAVPGSPTTKNNDNDEEQDKVLVSDEDERDNENFDEQEDIMKVFAKEVAMTDDEDDDSDSQDDDSDSSDQDDSGINIIGEGMMLYDDEEGLKEAIQGKIVDDSSAPVSPILISLSREALRD